MSHCVFLLELPDPNVIFNTGMKNNYYKKNTKSSLQSKQNFSGLCKQKILLLSIFCCDIKSRQFQYMSVVGQLTSRTRNYLAST